MLFARILQKHAQWVIIANFWTQHITKLANFSNNYFCYFNSLNHDDDDNDGINNSPSSSMELKHGPLRGNWRGIWMPSTSGVYVVY